MPEDLQLPREILSAADPSMTDVADFIEEEHDLAEHEVVAEVTLHVSVEGQAVVTDYETYSRQLSPERDES